MNSFAHGESTLAVEVTNISTHGIWLLANNKELFMPYESFPWFKEQPVKSIKNKDTQDLNGFEAELQGGFLLFTFL